MVGAHNVRLQSLRGVAALCVLFGHVSMVLPFRPLTYYWAGVFQPNSGVIFFYVLSGYVLGQSLYRDSTFGSFLVKRLARLLPVLWIAVLLGAATILVVAGPPFPAASDWLNGNRAGHVSVSEIIKNLVGYTVTMNGSLWSIQVELIMISILPLMVRASDRLSLGWNVVVLAALCVMSRLLFSYVRSFDGPQLFFLAYLHCFYLGIILPKMMKTANPVLTSGALACGGLLLSVVLYRFHPRLGISGETKLVIDALISGQIVAWAIASKASSAGRFLESRPMERLGDWSYSFYCYSMPIILIVAYYAFERLPPEAFEHTIGATLVLVAIGLGTLAILLPGAALSYRFIELPGIALGRSLLRKGSMKWA